MEESLLYSGNRNEDYELVIAQLQALSDGVNNKISVLSNASALLNDYLHTINWVGFYLMENNELVLGPFQGKVACTKISIGKGVCGTAVAERKTQRVADVHEFPGHIACDSASNSEIVVPLMKDDECIGVLDIDSPITNRFDEVDETYLNKFAKVLCKYL
ncbi:MAG: GAF domain-containing protein [Erysipelotrichales bacterium]|nr:GAF domain-containing protein [Erysipelotrichales bacterium]